MKKSIGVIFACLLAFLLTACGTLEMSIETVENTPAATMHVGDLDGSSASSKSKWDATLTILVHDANEIPVANATVSGVWSSGGLSTDSCITNASGVCQISITGLNSKTKSVTFTVSNVTQATLGYDSIANHDPDGDSNGTNLMISKQ